MNPVSPLARATLIVALVALGFAVGCLARLTLLPPTPSAPVLHPMLVPPSIITPMVHLLGQA